MPVDGTQAWTTTQWGRIPTQSVVTYAFATTKGSRELQDVGFNGLNDDEERQFYANYVEQIPSIVTNKEALDSILADPANDDYHYFRGADLDQRRANILERYKRINMPQGNSPDAGGSGNLDSSYKTTPDVEDINQDYTLNEYERYYQYHVLIRPEDLVVGQNFIVDKRTTSPQLRNKSSESVDWYEFRIPLSEFEKKRWLHQRLLKYPVHENVPHWILKANSAPFRKPRPCAR